MEKAKEFQKNIDFSFIDYAVVLTVWITTNWKILEEMGIPDHLTCMQVRKQQLEPDMKQQTGSKLEKEYKAVYCHSAYLTSMQSTSCKMPGWMNHKLESSIAGRSINNLRDADDTNLMAESEEELKSLLMRVQQESVKADLKLNIQ